MNIESLENKFQTSSCIICNLKFDNNEKLIDHFKEAHAIKIGNINELKMLRHLLAKDKSLKSKWLSWQNYSFWRI